MQAWMAPALRRLSEPPRRIAALPDFRQSAAASAMTLGRLSKTIPITPMGCATRRMRRPLGRVHSDKTRPTGSGSAATCSRPAAMASIRSGFRARRSRKAGARPSAAARSAALAARIAGVAARSAAAAAWRAASLAGRGARARSMAAARAARAAASNWRATASDWTFTAAGLLAPGVLSPAGGGGKAGGPRRARTVRRGPRFCSARTNAEGAGAGGCAPWAFSGDGFGWAACGVLRHSDKRAAPVGGSAARHGSGSGGVRRWRRSGLRWFAASGQTAWALVGASAVCTARGAGTHGVGRPSDKRVRSSGLLRSAAFGQTGRAPGGAAAARRGSGRRGAWLRALPAQEVRPIVPRRSAASGQMARWHRRSGEAERRAGRRRTARAQAFGRGVAPWRFQEARSVRRRFTAASGGWGVREARSGPS